MQFNLLGGLNMKKTLHIGIRQLMCFLLAAAMLLPMMPRGYAAAQNVVFGMLQSKQNRCVAVAVKDGAKTLVFSTSSVAENVGTKATFTVDDKTEITVTLAANDLGGTMQCWETSQKNTLPLYEIAKPSNSGSCSALYLSTDDSHSLVRRQTPAKIDSITADASGKLAVVALYQAGKAGSKQPIMDKALNLGLVLDGSGKAVAILTGTDNAVCSWYSSAKVSTGTKTFSGDSALLSTKVSDYLSYRSLENRNLDSASELIDALAESFAAKSPDMDVCFTSSAMIYRTSDLRSLRNGTLVADAGAYSNKNTFVKAAGSGVADEDYWYISYTFDSKSSNATIYYNVIALVIGSIYAENPDLLGKSSNHVDNAVAITDSLMENAKSGVGYSIGNLVLFSLVNSQGKVIIGVDSLPFFMNLNSSIVPKAISFK